jgi:hypothetical protein
VNHLFIPRDDALAAIHAELDANIDKRPLDAVTRVRLQRFEVREKAFEFFRMGHHETARHLLQREPRGAGGNCCAPPKRRNARAKWSDGGAVNVAKATYKAYR